MKLRLEVHLSRVTQNLFEFVDNVHRLCETKKDFTFGFNHGSKLYLDTCKGMQNSWYICPKKQSNIRFIIATLNYSLALSAFIHLTLEDKTLFFDISSTDDEDNVAESEDIILQKIISFADGLNLAYSII